MKVSPSNKLGHDPPAQGHSGLRWYRPPIRTGNAALEPVNFSLCGVRASFVGGEASFASSEEPGDTHPSRSGVQRGVNDEYIATTPPFSYSVGCAYGLTA